MFKSFKKVPAMFRFFPQNYHTKLFFSSKPWIYAEKVQLLNVEFINAVNSLSSHEKSPFVVLDVRNDDEITLADLPSQNEKGAEIPKINIPLYMLTSQSHLLERLPKDKHIICISEDGIESSRAAFHLKSRGYKALNLFGGIDGVSDLWRDIPKY